VIEAARVLLEEGAREVAAGAVHGVLAGPAIERLEASPLCEVVVTDTLPVASCLLAAHGSKTSGARTLRVLSVAPLLATAIQRIHDDESISALFT
jgi:ribose-phosphate pyrophosphokinase